MNTDKVPKVKELKDEYFLSDGLKQFEKLPPAQILRASACALEAALRNEDKKNVQLAANNISKEFCAAFQIDFAPVKVLGVRPRSVSESSVYELYGDYDTETRLIRLWMRTAVQKKPSAFGTFLSTLCHELCHHLDLVYLSLPNSYHTRGFYERAGILYHHMRDTPLKKLVWTKYSDGTYAINWPATMRGVAAK